MKFLPAILSTTFAVINKNSGPGTQCSPFTWSAGGAPGEYAIEAKTLSRAANIFETVDLNKAADGDAFEFRFSADDKVCERISYDSRSYTIDNSPIDSFDRVWAIIVTADPICTGGATAWTTATDWYVVSW